MCSTSRAHAIAYDDDDDDIVVVVVSVGDLLPPEIWQHIMKLLPLSDAVLLASTCKYMKAIFTDDVHWRERLRLLGRQRSSLPHPFHEFCRAVKTCLFLWTNRSMTRAVLVYGQGNPNFTRQLQQIFYEIVPQAASLDDDNDDSSTTTTTTTLICRMCFGPLGCTLSHSLIMSYICAFAFVSVGSSSCSQFDGGSDGEILLHRAFNQPNDASTLCGRAFIRAMMVVGAQMGIRVMNCVSPSSVDYAAEVAAAAAAVSEMEDPRCFLGVCRSTCDTIQHALGWLIPSARKKHGVLLLLHHQKMPCLT